MQINWSNILINSDATIEFFNTNWQGETPRSDADIALFSFPRNIHVELQWNRSQKTYLVTLYENDFELLRRVTAKTASDAICEVKTLSSVATQLAKGHHVQLSAAEEALRTQIRLTSNASATQSVRLEAGAR